MPSMNITTVRKNLYALVEELQTSHEPLTITSKNGTAVMVSEEDWRAIEETLFLTTIPGMRESILEGMAEPLSSCCKTLAW